MATYWDFTADSTSVIKTLRDADPSREQTFDALSLRMVDAIIYLYEAGQYASAVKFEQIGDIDGVAPTDLQDAYDKILAIIPAGGGGGSGNLQSITDGTGNNQTTNPLISTADGSKGVEIYPDDRGIRFITNSNEFGTTIKNDDVTEETVVQMPNTSGKLVIEDTAWANGLMKLATNYLAYTEIKQFNFSTSGIAGGDFEGITTSILSDPSNGTTLEYSDTFGGSVIRVNSLGTKILSDINVAIESTVSVNVDTTLFNYNNKEVLTVATGCPLGIVNTTTIALTTSDLNTAYPDATIGFEVYCSDIIAGAMIYKKVGVGWLGYVCIIP